LKLEIKDTGYGIAPELIDRVFDPFFTTKKKGEGTGMGLAMVHGIVKSHGGTVTVDSRPGQGSAFAIYLPCIDDQPQGPTTESLSLPKGTETILLVDDEVFQVDIGTQMLNRLGYRVVAQTDPQEALARFQKAPETIDLVISDMTMPQMTGDVLARALKAVRADIPIIICTGYSERINEASARSMGIAGLAMKPVVMKDIAHLIRKILEES
jgi:CheY-like chemotaxis protein